MYGQGRSERSNLSADAAYLQGDRSSPKRLLQIVRAQNIDTVVDVIPMMLADTEPLLACLDGEIDHYVMISSSDVYARYERLHKRATGGVNTGALDENAPLRTTRYPYRTDTPRPAGDPRTLPRRLRQDSHRRGDTGARIGVDDSPIADGVWAR